MQFDPDVVRHLAAEKALGSPNVSEMSLEQARAAYREAAARNGGGSVEMAEVREFSAPGPGGTVPLRLYRPAGVPDREAPLLVFIHGGGFVIGDLDSHDGVCRRIAKGASCLVASVGYRLAPESPAPAAAEDVVASLQWIALHAAEFGADPNRLAVGGDSAGGGLAAVAAIAARDLSLPLRSQILIYPSLDNRPTLPRYPSREANRDVPPLTLGALAWAVVKYLPSARLGDDWRQSPMVVADKAGLAPALFVLGERDPLRSEGLAFADELEVAGVEVSRLLVPGMIHGFITMSGIIAAADRAIEAIAAELRMRLS